MCRMGIKHHAALHLVVLMSQSLLLHAALVTQTVSYSDGDVQLEGFLAHPSDAVGHLPVVIHVHQWSGLSDFERGRANRTAEELGYIGFAVSIYDAQESAKAAGGMQDRIAIVGKYNAAPELFKTRLSAAVSYISTHAKANSTAIAAVGYCFGGTAVLQFARLGGAKETGVSGVVSFHGGLNGLDASPQTWDGTKVVVLNGAADMQIPKADIDAFQHSVTNAKTSWEFTNYGQAGHGFTHPKDGTDHFQYEKVAEERSWHSMSDFVENSLGFKDQETAADVSLDTEDVTYEDAGVNLTGYIASPAGATGPLPVLLHVHQWGGLSDFEKKRADRTAKELGYIGFAVSIYDAEETKAAANMQDRVQLVGKYNGDPELFKSRLGAAVTFAKKHTKADSSKIAAAGYCFGGTAVLQYARLGGAEAHGVSSVISFHGSLGSLVNKKSNFCPTRVAVYNGANDPMISDSDLVALQDALEKTGTHWELTNYSFAAHGFTHPTEAGNDHFHFEKHAEARSWNSMHQHLKDTFASKGHTASEKCVEYTPSTTSAAPVMDSSGDCMDDNAAVEKEAGAWGVKECASNLCEGQYADMMKPLCKKTCGLCKAMSDDECADDNAAVEKEAGAWGVKECSTNLCEGQYADMMKPLCKKTCGLCKTMSNTGCADDNAAVEKEAGAWGVKECSANLCEGQYADMMKPLCKKTCGLCDTVTSTAPSQSPSSTTTITISTTKGPSVDVAASSAQTSECLFSLTLSGVLSAIVLA